MADLTLWGRTRYNGITCEIWLDHTMKRNEGGATEFSHGRPTIYIRDGLTPKRIFQILIHEFVHVVEYMNDPDDFSTKVVEECTALAQTMEVGIGSLIWNLKVEKGFANPFTQRR